MEVSQYNGLDSLKVYVNQVKNTRDSSNDKKRKLSNGSEMEVSQYNGLEINYTRDDNGGLKELKINQIVQLKQLINDRKFSKKKRGRKTKPLFPHKKYSLSFCSKKKKKKTTTMTTTTTTKGRRRRRRSGKKTNTFAKIACVGAVLVAVVSRIEVAVQAEYQCPSFGTKRLFYFQHTHTQQMSSSKRSVLCSYLIIID